MGTNFYVGPAGATEASGTLKHIGKRNAGGLYCYDCNETLCRWGEGGIHHGRAPEPYQYSAGENAKLTSPKHLRKPHPQLDTNRNTGLLEYNWFSHCPKCGKEPVEGGKNAADVELGFAKPTDLEYTGVRSASTFSWADFFPYEFHEYVRDNPSHVIKDEYGQTFSYEEFVRDVLESCPVHYYRTIGVEFS